MAGAGTGALVGAAVAGGGTGNRIAGAAIGGALGGLIGNRIGAALDDEDKDRIGGKAAGMFLGYRILQGEREEHGSDPVAQVHLPESWFVRSDVIENFLHLNRLDEYQSQKYKPAEEIRNEYPLIRQIFQDAEFPLELIQRLDRVLDAAGNHPLIVRSSSLLEDRFGAAFSGMYASVFLGNQGSRKAEPEGASRARSPRSTPRRWRRTR